MTNDVYALKPGECQPTWVLEPDGRLMSAGRAQAAGRGDDALPVAGAQGDEPRVAHWLRALSDGFVDMDADDPYVKAPGPVVIRRLPHELADAWESSAPRSTELRRRDGGLGVPQAVLDRPAGARRRPGGLQTLPAVHLGGAGRRTRSRRRRSTTSTVRAGAKMVPFAG